MGGILSGALLGKPLGQTAGFWNNGKASSHQNVYSAAIAVDLSLGLIIGATYTPLTGIATVVTNANLLTMLEDAAKRGLAWWITNMVGTETEGTRQKKSFVTANKSTAGSTSIFDGAVEMQLGESRNVDFTNLFGGNTPPEVGWYLFTDTTFKYIATNIEYDAKGASMTQINSTSEGSRKFGIMYRSYAGELPHIDGYFTSATKYPKFPIVQGALTNATSPGTNGGKVRVSRTAAGVVEIALSVATYSVNWKLVDAESDDDTLIKTLGITFVNGKINIPSAVAVQPPFVVRAIAYSATGISGEIAFQIEITA
jgi:hypothetical protein